MDLFEQYEKLPEAIQGAIDQFNEDNCSYQECRKLLCKLEPLGYTFESGLDGIPFNLTKITT